MWGGGYKVDIIYIDPPYNTGNKDFVYNDSFVSNDDNHKHSKWLSFMKKRLILARELLADDGVIFISIDDNEQAYLKVLMDEIFGEENFVANLIWAHKSGGGNDEKNISTEHEYVLVYRKTNSFVSNKNKVDINEGDYNKIFNNKKAKYVPLVKWGAGANDSLESLGYSIIDDEGDEYFPTKPDGSRGRWRKKPENCEYIIWEKNRKGIKTPYEVILMTESKKSLNFRTLLLECDTTSKGSILMKEIFNNKVFPFPKPVKLIKFLMNLHSKNNSIILDFFAGSGTTAQAVMELNQEDGGNRRFIVCTNNENNIAREICRERIYRVINGIGSKNESIDWKYSDEIKSFKNNNVKYLKVKPINKVDGEFEDINNMKDVYKKEFNKDISTKDFK